MGICLVAALVAFRVGAAPPAPSGFLYESGAFGVVSGEFAAAKFINVDTVSHNYRVVIYRASGASLPIVLDTGVQTAAAGSLVYAIGPVESLGAQDDYSVEITTDSDRLIPTVIAQTPGCDPNCHIERIAIRGSELVSFRQIF
jgi:hypothetical protein